MKLIPWTPNHFGRLEPDWLNPAFSFYPDGNAPSSKSDADISDPGSRTTHWIVTIQDLAGWVTWKGWDSPQVLSLT